ncbi:hypothetical protein AL053_21520 [Pseudomonas savastanoi pv. fraxini]|nr:hypothetical protein [Pseudomonas savastanoi]KWS73345.1 hypothetical protein AL053_21520 [Pseudomonas savastanoi pv. fraxini]
MCLANYGLPPLRGKLIGASQEPFTMPASFSGALETQRGTIDLSETVITSRMGLYLAAGVAQNSTVKAAQFGIRKV